MDSIEKALPLSKIHDGIMIGRLIQNNPFSLAIVENGKKRIGEKLYAVSPLKNKNIPVEVISSHYVDPKGERVRS